MFIYLQYSQFHDIIYWSKNPILILVSLLVVCLSFSYVINDIKNKIDNKEFRLLLNR